MSGKGKPKTDEELVADYLANAAAWREQYFRDNPPKKKESPGITWNGGILTVTLPSNAKSISELGGTEKVFGRSQFAIPEFRIIMDEYWASQEAKKKQLP